MELPPPIPLPSSRWAQVEGFAASQETRRAEVSMALNTGIELGKEQGRQEVIDAALERLDHALYAAFDEAEIVFLEARRDFGLNPSRIYLRREGGPFSFEALYLIPEGEFASDPMLDLLLHAQKREGETGPDCTLHFLFMPHVEGETKHEVIMAGGYAYYYDREGDEA